MYNQLPSALLHPCIASLEDHKDVSGISLSGDNQGFVLQGRYQFTVKIFLQSKKAKVNIKNR